MVSFSANPTSSESGATGTAGTLQPVSAAGSADGTTASDASTGSSNTPADTHSTNISSSMTPPNPGYLPASAPDAFATEEPAVGYLANTHSAAPTAAIAIPLVLVGIAVLAAFALWVRHHRSTARLSESPEDIHGSRMSGYLKHASSIRSNVSISQQDIEKAILSLAEKADPYAYSFSPSYSLDEGLNIPVLRSSESYAQWRPPDPRRDMRREQSHLRDARYSGSTLPSRLDRSASRSHWKLKRKLFASDEDNAEFYTARMAPEYSYSRRGRYEEDRPPAELDDRGSIYSGVEAVRPVRPSHYHQVSSPSLPRQPPRAHSRSRIPVPEYAKALPQSPHFVPEDMNAANHRAANLRNGGRVDRTGSRTESIRSTRPGGVKLV